MKFYLLPAFWACIILTSPPIDAQTALTPGPESRGAPAPAVPTATPPSPNNQTPRPAMSEGRSSDRVQSWIDRLSAEFTTAAPHGVRQEAAYAQWFDEQVQRREGRREAFKMRFLRVHDYRLHAETGEVGFQLLAGFR